MALSKPAFLALLSSEIENWFRDSVLGGAHDYDQYNPALTRDHPRGLVAGIRNCHIVGRARRLSAYMPTVLYHPHRGRPLFIVRDMICVSYKKLDRNLRPCNSRTQQAIAYNGQVPLFTDMPSVTTNLVVGYRPTNAAETEFEVYIICPDGERNLWEHPLSGVQVLELPFATPAPVAPTTTQRPARVRIKGAGGQDGNITAG